MTMQRGSMVFAAEGYQKGTTKSNFGLGRGYYKGSETRCRWIHAPPGTFFGTTQTRTAAPIRAMGTKTWDTVVYGQFTGSFNWTFNLDYEYLHPLIFVLEDYEKTIDGAQTVYTLKKSDVKRVKSFTVLRTILNVMAGGPDDSDEIEQLMGCVVARASFARNSTTSNVSVTLTGMYAKERMFKGTLTRTDYDYGYEPNLAEYMCMFVADDKSAIMPNMYYVANTDQLTIDIENGAERIYNTCSPFASAYMEGVTTYSFGTSCYSNNPENYKQRLYGGGDKVDPSSGLLMPRVKGLKPLAKVMLLTYSKSAQTAATLDEEIDEDEIKSAFDSSKYNFSVAIEDVIIKELTWPKGDGQKMMDIISNAAFKYMTLEFRCRDDSMGDYDLFEDPAMAAKIKHTCDNPVIKGEGFDW